MITLFEFQKQAILSVKQKLLSCSAVILCSATGSGKTYIASQYIKEHLAENPNNRVLVLVGLQVLVVQNYESFIKFGYDVSVLHDLIKRDSYGNRLPFQYKNRVLLTMPETFINTIEGGNELSEVWMQKWQHWKPTLIVIDEGHKGTSSGYQKIRDMFPDAKILGLTATPYRTDNVDGKSLFDWYGNNLVTTISVEELISIGILVKPRYVEEGSEYFTPEKWVEHTKNHVNKRTIVFTRDTSHSLKVLDAFTSAGISAEIITGGCEDEDINPDTPLQRQEKFNNFNNGKTTVLISVNALCEGFDSKKVQFCFLLRDVKNKALYHQIVGRALRAWIEGNKTEAVIVDFFGNIERFGPIEAYEWSIEMTDDMISVTTKSKPVAEPLFRKKRVVFYICDKCHAVFDTKKFEKCPGCSAIHHIQIFNKVKNKFVEITGNLPDSKLKKIWEFLKKDFEFYQPGTEIWNRAEWNVSKVEIFKHRKGGFLPEYKWLETSLSESLNLSDNVIFHN